MNFTFTEEEIGDAKPGDVITLQGQRVKLLKRTNFNVSVEPYRWYDALGDFISDLFRRIP